MNLYIFWILIKSDVANKKNEKKAKSAPQSFYHCLVVTNHR